MLSSTWYFQEKEAFRALAQQQKLTSYIASMQCLGSTEGSCLLGCHPFIDEAEQKMHASIMLRDMLSIREKAGHMLVCQS